MTGTDSVKAPPLWVHLRDVILLPVTVSVIVPYLIYDPAHLFLPGWLLLKTAGLVLLTGGLALLIYTNYLFRSIGKGSLAPWSPTQKLIVTGPYRYCRNPMISGVLFILTGEALFFHSVEIALWAILFFGINTTYFMLKEEPDLFRRFGDNYRKYRENVPRWIPRLKPYRQ